MAKKIWIVAMIVGYTIGMEVKGDDYEMYAQENQQWLKSALIALQKVREERRKVQNTIESIKDKSWLGSLSHSGSFDDVELLQRMKHLHEELSNEYDNVKRLVAQLQKYRSGA